MFHKIKEISLNELDIKEMRKFHQMLLKMKKRRPNFNVDRVMTMLYGKKYLQK